MDQLAYFAKYGDDIRGHLLVMGVMSLGDAEINRALGLCVGGHWLVPLAIYARDNGLLTMDGLELRTVAPEKKDVWNFPKRPMQQCLLPI